MLKSMGLQIRNDLAAEQDLPGGSDDKVSERHAVGDPGSIPGWGRSPGKGNATHSSILAWKISWTEESERLSPLGRKELDKTERLH